MLHLLRLPIFAAFVLLGVTTQIRRGSTRARRQRVNLFIGFVVFISLAVGLSRRESWPFATWAVVSGLGPEEITNYDFELVSGDGRTVRLDPRVWQPASDNEILDGWVAWHIDETPPAQRDELARFVLDRAERARQKVRSGGSAGVNGWVFGPLAAPYAFRRGPLWNSAADVPAAPFVTVRLVKERWNVLARFHHEAAIARQVVYEYRAR